MGAAQEGAGREQSFGLNIRLPWEQEANPWIADDPKLINFKFFFVRKLFLVKEADAIALFPGGFGTMDEVFEVLTLVQTGKTALVPLVLLDVPGGNYWKRWEALIREALLGRDLIGSEDLHLFYVTDSVEDALSEVFGFYRRYHSMRFVGDQLLIRLKNPLGDETLLAVEREWSDILGGAVKQVEGPLKGEGEEEPGLSRLVLPFDRQHYGRLRQLINFLNSPE
jgi:predicted Rossmann-fold nucleotide-binding protein